MQTTKQGLAAMLAETDAAGALRETSTDALLIDVIAETQTLGRTIDGQIKDARPVVVIV